MRWNFILSIILLAAAAGGVIVRNSRMVYATPETQSRFFKSFSIDQALAPFIDYSAPHAMAFGGPSSSGAEFATHRKSIEPRFRLKGDEASLLASFREYVKLELVRYGGRMIREEIDPNRKTVIQYIAGQTRGTVTIFSLAPLQESFSLAMIQIDEQWRPLK